MRTKIRSAILLAFCVSASLAASRCAPSPGSAAPSDEKPAPGRLAEVTWTRESKPEEIAAWALEGCRGHEQRIQCLDKALIPVIQPAGVDKVMAALLIMSKQDTDVDREGHVLAHGIGIAAYTTPETVSEAFERCTTDFQSGCYHGVIQAYFADDQSGGVTAEKMNALCADYRTPEKRWLDFQCSHGMGHGLMAVNDHHLLKALDACDLLEERFEEQGCWGGAFMENVVNTTHPHHTETTQVAAGGEGGGHEGGHGGGGHADGHGGEHAAGHGDAHAQAASGHSHDGGGGEKFMALDPNEPLYPCNVVREHHRRQCYLMQTSAILWRSNGDFVDASRQCLRAPEDMRETCFQSLGRDANSWGRGDAARAIAYCAESPDDVEPFCIVGVVKNIVDVTAKPLDGLEFCKQVPGASKPACYRAVGQQIGLLQPTAEGRERECAVTESGYLTECRFGAGLGLLRTED